MAFDPIESPDFQRIFQDLTISLPFTSRKTLSRRVEEEFESRRAQLIDGLDRACQTISISIDFWTSRNSKSILAVIGHWLTIDFQYQEQVLEFAESVACTVERI
ncbi:hypothetical protein LIPSTDRAFT_336494 [Lipomyces starkeyi NRRL Y-11557]|uniref:HAT C-terminal dimerisation domain-containing protein n=1 Tax=Lipomyces starkeyi NRRL Y-11557 TaxID=675824 RepID=A0A1E3Q8J5_LIPST|nr:hypothetical protein LIPSTDRAFT_336494 [Lipomyces starkeyi NRRL Y-11557]